MNNKKIIIILRIIHGLITFFLIFSITYLYYTIATRKFGYFLFVAIIALILEGILLFVNKGKCPLIGIHEKYGDNKSFFDLFLPKKVVPYITLFLEIVAIIGFIFISLIFIRII